MAPLIRPLAESEMPLLRRLLADYLLEWDPSADPAGYWHDDYIAAFRAGLAAGTLAILLLWSDAPDDGEPLGCAIARIERAWYRAGDVTGIVEEFYITPAYRRHGHGRALAEAIFAQLRRMGATVITAQVLRENTRALHFWQGIGMSIEVYQLYRLAT
jgi:ribosomal protein S18 acetylase RimI-like enzyme